VPILQRTHPGERDQVSLLRRMAKWDTATSTLNHTPCGATRACEAGSSQTLSDSRDNRASRKRDRYWLSPPDVGE
jgi:hypothetical protein